MEEKANISRGDGAGGWLGWWLGLAVLACLAAFSVGLWYGGWTESLKLRSALSEIPDINRCFTSVPS